MLRMKNLTVEYPDGTKALDNVSISAGSGETIGIIGANGAGKSSLLNSIVGVTEIRSGEIYVNNISLNKKTLKGIRNMVGMVFQNPDDQIFMTSVAEDVAFGLRNAGCDDEYIEKKVRNVLEELGISHLATRNPGKLSGGEKRRVALAGVIALEPEVILFDEPTAFLDPAGKRELLPIMDGLPMTKLIASHDLDFIKEICGRILVLKCGIIVADGATDTILQDEKQLYNWGL